LLQLICIFVTEEELDHVVEMIAKTYTVASNKLFILSIENSNEFICSFNVEKGFQRKQLSGAMLVHRKKETNTMYTINSLNALIKLENDGILDSSFSVDWSKYKNSLLVTSNNELKVLATKVYQIINL
jgi:hypothetical protein